MTKAVQAVEVSTCCTLLYSECDLEVAQMKLCSLIQKLILYKFKLGHNTRWKQPKTLVVQKVKMQLIAVW